MGRLLLILVFAGVTASPGYADHHNRFVSPSGKVVIERRWKDEGGSVLWVVDPDGARKELRILDSPRLAWPVFFRDDDLLVVNHAKGSNHTQCQLYRRNEDGRYAQTVLVSDEAWQFFRKSTGRSIDGLDHRYCFAISAIDEPQALLLRLSAHGGPRFEPVHPWYCLYHLESGRFFLNLAELNRRNEEAAGKGGKK